MFKPLGKSSFWYQGVSWEASSKGFGCSGRSNGPAYSRWSEVRQGAQPNGIRGYRWGGPRPLSTYVRPVCRPDHGWYVPRESSLNPEVIAAPVLGDIPNSEGTEVLNADQESNLERISPNRYWIARFVRESTLIRISNQTFMRYFTYEE